MCEQEGLKEYLNFPTASTSQFTNEQDEAELFKWNHNTTIIFLDLYKEYRKQVGSLKIKNLKKMFEEIAKELRYETKQGITAANCENRWKHLERMYKKYVDNNNKTGRGRKDFEYAEIMDKILGKKRNIHPAILLSSDTVLLAVEDTEDITDLVDDTNNTDTVETNNTKKINEASIRKTPVKSAHMNKKLRIHVLKEIRNDRKDFYKKFLEMEEKKLLEKQRKNTILEKRNTILEQLHAREYSVIDIENLT